MSSPARGTLVLSIVCLAIACEAASGPCNPARNGSMPCWPHGTYNVVSETCWGDGSLGGPCFPCYKGANCTEFDKAGCADLFVATGWPLLFQDVWTRFPCPNGDPVTSLPSDFGMSYMFTPTMMLDTLEQRIRQLHEAVGNVKNVSSYHVLPCYGGTGCGQAVINALATVLGEREKRQYTLAGQRPLYFDYPNWAPAANGGEQWALIWNQSAIEDPARLGEDGDVVELLNTPANPDGAHRMPVVMNTSKLIVDAVFNWPYQNQLPVVELDYPVQLYSMSKNTGHAGTRFGWALIQDDAVYQEALNHIGVTTLGVSIDGQARAATILKAVLQTLQEDLNSAIHNTDAPVSQTSAQGSFYNQSKVILSDRWSQIELAAKPCPSTRSMRLVNTDNGGANLWLKFEPNGIDAEGVLYAQAGLRAIGGSEFLVDPSYARINMLVSSSTFSILRDRIEAFCMPGVGIPGTAAAWRLPGQRVMAP